MNLSENARRPHAGNRVPHTGCLLVLTAGTFRGGAWEGNVTECVVVCVCVFVCVYVPALVLFVFAAVLLCPLSQPHQNDKLHAVTLLAGLNHENRWHFVTAYSWGTLTRNARENGGRGCTHAHVEQTRTTIN